MEDKLLERRSEHFMDALHEIINKGFLKSDCNETGQETFSGISRNYWSDWEGWKYYDAGQRAPFVMIQRFYRKNYWNRINGDKICELSVYIAVQIFQVAVDLSVTDSCRFLQRALNIMNRDQKDYLNIIEDGHLGLKTMITLTLCLQNNTEQMILKIFKTLVAQYHLSLVKKHPERPGLRTWFDRP